MTDINNKHSHGFLSNAFGVAKKISAAGMGVLNHAAPSAVTKVLQPSKNGQLIDGSARQTNGFEVQKYDNPQQMLREYLPNVSKQLLGRQYGKVTRVANFVSPQFSDKLSDYFFEQLNQFTSNLSSVDAVLDQAGAKDLQELTQDVDRSKRISQALAEQNKWIASMQGALTGATGVVGSAIDVPLSLIMSLRMIYQVGRAYGFELNKETEQDIVQFVFKQIDLGQIAEKQSVLMALKAVSGMLRTHDVSQFQQMLGSSNDAAALKKWLSNENGEMKWDWLNHIPKISIISKLTPVAGAGIGAAYSWKLVEDVNQKAQQIFSHARSYLQQHQGVEISPIAAYEKSLALLAQAAPKLLEHLPEVDVKPSELKLDQDIQIPDNSAISNVTIKKKTEAVKADEDHQDEQVEQGLESLAEQMVEPHEQVEPQKPAVPVEEPESNEAKQNYDSEDQEEESAQKSAQSSSETSEQKDETAATKSKVTKKKS
ncbi:EcsC family protein [Acinetobacter terrestris]|uniref:EcsC family protein n=1 Tax=Acinetobacter terrestris TaxID=2529843 RepID=A0ABX1UX27_9GAMM|nr:EcsC family protein [Acinetobacter terrestris]NNH26679.1 EcsC family protein [Acinetobacter terrestris]